MKAHVILLYIRHIYVYVYTVTVLLMGRVSDWLRAGWSGDRIPVGARFSTPVQTGPGTQGLSRG